MIKKLKNKRGFTLIELIVVLAVLAVIMSIAIPRFIGVQNKAKADADQATLEMIAKAAEMYYVQVGSLPDIDDLQTRGDIETGLKFQVDNVTITDTNTTITRDPSTGAITVTR
jgi:prepilin-type N-terminal cleavage/methylation domain-containing protein